MIYYTMQTKHGLVVAEAALALRSTKVRLGARKTQIRSHIRRIPEQEMEGLRLGWTMEGLRASICHGIRHLGAERDLVALLNTIYYILPTMHYILDTRY